MHSVYVEMRALKISKNTYIITRSIIIKNQSFIQSQKY